MAEPLVMPQDEFEFVKDLRDRISDAIEVAWWSQGPGCTDRVMEIVAPLAERAEAAEAKLAAIAEHCRDRMRMPGRSGMSLGAATVILGIIGSGEGHSATCSGCGQQYADEETSAYLFTSRETLVRHLDADRWLADPVLCPACQPEEPAP